MEFVAQLIGGSFDSLILRVKKGVNLQLGEILVYEDDKAKYFVQVYDLQYSSQISSANMEMISGLNLEHNLNLEFFDEELQLYTLAFCKNLLFYDKSKNQVSTTKSLPELFSKFRRLNSSDLEILSKPENSIFVGYLRSGSENTKIKVFFDGVKVFRHHVLVAATTGRGKSNLTSVILWNSLFDDRFSFLVLDPHDEYFGRNRFGLKDHPTNKVVYYTNSDIPPGQRSLIINIKLLKPNDFFAVSDWSPAQREAMLAYYSKYREEWISVILSESEPSIESVLSPTFLVVKRRLSYLLDVTLNEDKIVFNGIFVNDSKGLTTLKDICNLLESGKSVIIDTSTISSSQEIIIGSMIASNLFFKYHNYKRQGLLNEKAQIVILLEEAPRVLGKEVLKSSENIFSTIAREGRKFKIGLYAITQLPSLIPRQILANMNTKIILGIEMKPERQAIIESSANDLSAYDKSIASLNVGESIISSTFFGFAVPIKVPLFDKSFADEVLNYSDTFKEDKEDEVSYDKSDLEIF